MHQSMLSPRVGGPGIPKGFDKISYPVGRVFDTKWLKYSKCMTNLTKGVVLGVGNLTKLVSKMSNPPGYARPPYSGA